MTAPFRDLFVELPRAVFDALHAWGEAVIVKAQRPPPAPAPRPRILTALDYPNNLALRYGWRKAETWRMECDHLTEIVVRLSCYHRQRISIDDLAILRCPTNEQIYLIDRIVDNAPRDCYCVQRWP